MRIPNLGRCLSTSLLLLSSMQVSAGTMQLEEVVVTAQKRSQSLQDVPISVSAVSGEKLNEAGITNFADLSAYVPNFQKSDTALGPVLLIRGIGSGVNQGFEQSVVQYADEIAMGRAPLARMPFMDLERVEILRGPQNVLFGKNSVGGALSLTTNKPGEVFEGSVTLEYEPAYDQQTATMILSGPLSDSVRGRLVARSYEEDGYFENLVNGQDEAARDEFALRGIIVWDVRDDITATLKVEQASFDSRGRNDEMFMAYPQTSGPLSILYEGLTYPQIGAQIAQSTGQDFGSENGVHDYKRATNVDEFSEIETNNITLKVGASIGAIEITSISAWVDYNTDELCDCDLSGFDLLSISQREDYRQFSQELRFASPGGDVIDWIGGIFYQGSSLDYESFSLVDDENLLTALGALGDALGPLGEELSPIALGAGAKTSRDYRNDSDVYAAFGQATWNISQLLRITLGVRYTAEDKKGSRGVDSINESTGQFEVEQAIVINTYLGTDLQSLGVLNSTASLGADYPIGTFSTHYLYASRSEESVTPSLVIEWDVSDDSMLYGSVATGFKAGGFDARGNLAENFEYEDESVLTYEMGVKNRFANGLAELNAAVFYTNYKDLQVSQFDGQAGFFVGNAPRATTEGVELDGRLLLAEGLVLNASMAYLDFEFKEFTGACSRLVAIETGELECDYAGRSNIFTPQWSASVGLAYRTGLTSSIDFQAAVDINYVDEQYVEVTLYEPLKQDAYSKVNARIGLEAESWTLALIGRNLTDEEVIGYISEVTLSGGNPIFAPAYSALYERPRTVALQGSYRF